MKILKRDIYLKKIIPFINKNIIKVIIGQRRVGKSYILLQIIDYIKANDKKSNIIYISKEEHEFSNIVTDDNFIKVSYKGIEHLNVLDFLCE